jgi:hypothetical protein
MPLIPTPPEKDAINDIWPKGGREPIYFDYLDFRSRDTLLRETIVCRDMK